MVFFTRDIWFKFLCYLLGVFSFQPISFNRFPFFEAIGFFIIHLSFFIFYNLVWLSSLVGRWTANPLG